MQEKIKELSILCPLKILDATVVTREQRTEVHDYFSAQLGYRVLFVECVCDDGKTLESNCREILRHSLDYAGMDAAKAAEDLRLKIAHYQKTHQPMDEAEGYPFIRVDTATMAIRACKVNGHVETSVLGYLASVSLKPHTLYFSRVSDRVILFLFALIIIGWSL